MTGFDGAELPDREELLVLLAERARAGVVPAIKLYLEELRRDGDDEGDEVSELDALDNVTAISSRRLA